MPSLAHTTQKSPGCAVTRAGAQGIIDRTLGNAVLIHFIGFAQA